MNHPEQSMENFQHKLYLIFFSANIRRGYLGRIANQATQIIMDCEPPLFFFSPVIFTGKTASARGCSSAEP